MVKLDMNRAIDPKEMRAAYCEALMDAAEENSGLIALDCDLGSSMGTAPFARKYKQRHFNCGIQEANVCGMAAGLSATGFIPFVHSFAVFTSRRICDQVFISCAYSRLNVKLIGGDAGVSAANNGGTHMAFEDVGIMRTIPGITILDPSDTVMMRKLIPEVAGSYGVHYVRMARKKVRRIYTEDSKFVIGQAEVLRDGTDVSIIASGIMVYEALQAADRLAAEGYSVRVVDMFTIKPIDKACIIDSARKTGAIVTAENHNIINGLGSAVAEVLGENCPVPMYRVGVRDEFGEVGPQDYLMRRFGLTADDIYDKAKKVMEEKKNVG